MRTRPGLVLRGLSTTALQVVVPTEARHDVVELAPASEPLVALRTDTRSHPSLRASLRRTSLDGLQQQTRSRQLRPRAKRVAVVPTVDRVAHHQVAPANGVSPSGIGIQAGQAPERIGQPQTVQDRLVLVTSVWLPVRIDPVTPPRVRQVTKLRDPDRRPGTLEPSQRPMWASDRKRFIVPQVKTMSSHHRAAGTRQ